MASATHFGDANSGFQARTINGTVNTELHTHLPPERPETPPKPSAVIPFSRDTDFIERGTILDQIHHTCTVPGSRAALIGLGGVGKSQLAIEYAYRARERSPDTWVLWVHASNAARFEQSFRDIANRVKISGRQNPGVNIFQLVHDWLLDERNAKWVLILDNVDDAGFLVAAYATGEMGPTNRLGDKQSRPIIWYLPQCPNGSILITTRSRNAALKLVEQRDSITVEPMSRADALALFKRKLGGHDGGADDDVAELVTALECMPLALVQAATYISQRAPRYSVREYLQDFRKSERKRISLLDQEGEQVRRDWEAKNSIIITWQISFDHIRKVRPSAADLLSLMSFFDRQWIPEDLLRSRSERRHSRQDQKESNDDISIDDTGYDSDDEDKDDTSLSLDSDEFEDDVLALRNYSFISINADGATLEMHGLVQLATRRWLEGHGQRERWKEQFIRNLCVELPTGEYENWARCQALFPHVTSAAAQQPEAQDSLKDWALILYKAAWYAWRIGNGAEAEKMSVQAMKVRKRILGREHEETLSSMVMVGLAYKLGGQWDAAEKLEVQVMETRKKKLGADHPDTLSSMNNLASTYRTQGRWEAAEELQVQVMETCKKKLGADHPDTLTSMANLASTYWTQGRWEAAEELQVQVIETRKKKLGADHPDTLSSMNNLASTYWNQGRWEAAEELQVQVMETRKKKLGADHPDTLSSMNNLASTYWNQGRWDAAEELQVQVMETSKTKLGADHPDTLTSMANLASTYWTQGRWEAAEELEIQVMETRKKKLGADHPDTLSSMNNLASTYWTQGRWEAAEELQVQVMETRKKKLGADHPDTLSSMNNLASTYWNQGRWEAAEELQVQVMETRKKKLGADHPDTLTSIANLASTYSNQGRWEAAEELQVQVMETSKTKLGADHPDTLTSMANLASTYWTQGRWEAAEELQVQVMETRKKKLGADHPDTLSSMNNLASTYWNHGRWEAAEELEIQVMETCKKKLGADHPDTLTSMNNLAFTWKAQGRHPEAVSLMKECVQLRQRVLRANHPAFISSSRVLARWEAEQADVGATATGRCGFKSGS